MSVVRSTPKLTPTLPLPLPAGTPTHLTQLAVCLPMQLAAQWLVIGAGDVSLYLQREIGLSTFLGAIQTYCLKVVYSSSSCLCLGGHQQHVA